MFIYASYVMGVSPSVTDFQGITGAFRDACLTSGVGGSVELAPSMWKGVLYIDDLDTATTGRVDDENTGL